ncbi:hypothetical protein UA45_19970 [Morganella morganii]|uniref:Uncharacterized protein n=1 Tax=Morganella morganii TaxID=582 RepID=A0A0D8L5P2_MORMO|nr:hypothetical protein UA45_19970 [Morganella morganii]
MFSSGYVAPDRVKNTVFLCCFPGVAFLLLLFILLSWFYVLLHILFCDLKKNRDFLIIYSVLYDDVKNRVICFFMI